MLWYSTRGGEGTSDFYPFLLGFFRDCLAVASCATLFGCLFHYSDGYVRSRLLRRLSERVFGPRRFRLGLFRVNGHMMWRRQSETSTRTRKL